jgi:hypothetical protein
MKSAKEWAAKVVIDSGWIEDGEAAVAMCQPSQVEKARAIVERLVIRAQEDTLDEFERFYEEHQRLHDGEKVDFDLVVRDFREKYFVESEEG